MPGGILASEDTTQANGKALSETARSPGIEYSNTRSILNLMVYRRSNPLPTEKSGMSLDIQPKRGA